MIIARLDHHGGGVQVKQLTEICLHLIVLPSTQDFLDKVGVNLTFGLFIPVEVIRLHVGDLHAVGWGEGP